MMNNLSSMFMNLPGPFKVGVLLLGAGGASGGALLLGDYLGIGYYLFYIVLIASIVAAIAIFLYKAYKKWSAKKKGMSLSQDVGGNAAAAPRDVSDPNQLADIDRVRGDFEKGMERLKSAGRNVYSEPWYLMVGEPGGGKTEALRHSRLDFVPGFQDRLQGAGGTLGMHWWFTTSGIILDTAGRLMFDATPEWDELLRILRKHRPFKPVNGLILVIPAKSLIRDDDREFEDKGRRIAEGLQYIKTKLDVCFPVYVVVTMCDLIPGFTEFFEDLHDPELQDQILGWSNPDPAGEGQSLNPEDAGKYTMQVRDRLAARRLAKILNAQQHSDSYADSTETKVEDLYAFPDGLQRLAPRLQRYLEMAFAAGGWGKPLFLRGIYFTSAMTEGATLDEALAEVLNIPVKELPEETRVARDKSYFLRHVFLKKVFMEQGLVSPASDVRRIRRKRRIAFATISGIAAIVLLAFMIYASSSFKKTVSDPQRFWTALSSSEKTGTPTGAERLARQQIVRVSATGEYEYHGNDPAAVDWDGSPTLDAFFHVASEPALQSAKANWIFRPAAWFTGNFSGDIKGRERRDLFRLLYEQTTLRPLVNATANKLRQEDEFDESAVDALEQLLQLYAAVEHPERFDDVSDEDAAAMSYVDLEPILAYLFDEAGGSPNSSLPQEDIEDLQASLVSVYEPAEDYSGGWPPKSIAAADLRMDLRPIIDNLNSYWDTRLSLQGGDLGKIQRLHEALVAYDAAEQELLDLRKPEEEYSGTPAEEWTTRFSALNSMKLAVDAAVADAPPNFESLAMLAASEVSRLQGTGKATYNRLIDAAGGTGALASEDPAANDETESVEPVEGDEKSASEESPPSPTATGLVRSLVDARDRIDAARPFGGTARSTSGTSGEASSSDFDFRRLDQRFLELANGSRLYSWRYALYDVINGRMTEGEQETPGLGEFAAWASGISSRLKPIDDKKSELGQAADGKPLEDQAQQLADWSKTVIGETRIKTAANSLLNQLAGTDMEGLRRLIGRIPVEGEAGKMSVDLALVGKVAVPSEFVPARASAALEGWTILANQTGDRRESREFRQAEDLISAFRDQFEEFWTSGITKLVAVNWASSESSAWSAFVNRIQGDESRRFRKIVIDPSLRAIVDWRRTAAQSIASDDSEIQALISLDQRIFDDALYGDASEFIVNFYKDEAILNREEALRIFNAFSNEQRQDFVTPTLARLGTSDRSESIVLAYWDSLNITAAKLLQQAGAEEARFVREQLAGFRVFPFARDAVESVPAASWSEKVARLRDLVQRTQGLDGAGDAPPRRGEIGEVESEWLKAKTALKEALPARDRQLIDDLAQLAAFLDEDPPTFELLLWNKEDRGEGHIQGRYPIVIANDQPEVDMRIFPDERLAELDADASRLKLAFTQLGEEATGSVVQLTADWLPLRLLLSSGRIGLVQDVNQWRIEGIEDATWLGPDRGWGITLRIREPGTSIPTQFIDLRLKPENAALSDQVIKDWPKLEDWSGG